MSTIAPGERAGWFAILGATFCAWTAVVFLAAHAPSLAYPECDAQLTAKGITGPAIVFPMGTIVIAVLALVVGGALYLARGRPPIPGTRALTAALTTLSGFIGLYVPQLRTPGIDAAFAQFAGTLPAPTQWMLGSFTVPLVFCVVIWTTAMIGERRSLALLGVSAVVSVVGLLLTLAAVTLPQVTMCSIS